MPNPYLVHSDTLDTLAGQGHWADLEPELREQILRLAQPAPTATVAYADTARLGGLEVFQFRRKIKKICTRMRAN